MRLLLAVKALFSSVLYTIRLVASAPTWICECVLPGSRWLSSLARGSANQSVPSLLLFKFACIVIWIVAG
jgi:hypothetical protein